MSISAIKKLRGFTTFSLHERGFTLIELLIVIAVLGVLAAGVLIAINPAEQLARARDATRKTAVGQLSKATQAYYTSQNSYPTENATWITTLVNAGEVKSVPGATGYSITTATQCDTNTQPASDGGYCYDANAASSATEAIMFVRMESGSENAKCTSGQAAWFLWSSTDGRAGVVCTAGDTTNPTAMGGYTYK